MRNRNKYRMQIIEAASQEEIKKIMGEIKVDPYGIKIMAPKATGFLLKINSVSNITANILKQEMLSLGADAAIARGALTGGVRITDCLLMGTLSQYLGLREKLKRQPFGLDKLGEDIFTTLAGYQKNRFILALPQGVKIDIGKRTYLMGVINVTPDSFSNDGLYAKPKSEIVGRALGLIDDGADIIDVGGESSRPQAKPVRLSEELKRTIPVIRALSKRTKTPISIDTYKPDVAEQALDNGAGIINDITGLGNDKMLKVASRYKATVVIMHMKGTPSDMQRSPKYSSVIEELIGFFRARIEKARQAGIKEGKIILDPGIGFGKTVRHNLEILRRLKEFKTLGMPILIGTSRKSFLGKILNAATQERIYGTVSSCILAAKNGANILRVHDCLALKQALKVLEAVDNYHL